ncbi:NAD-dependent succinate-semialdehyde dehydrogenase [Comamonas sp. NoAH]|uniref:NAD-dependent succinate-semialdehyde dehydrogenase n=1 Tax=Comamonas halotolerans TaxID=3041496 RepID=UPI0024E0A0B6|nr:NAD-dependent succinate-semialdehyde dehydrogenase [Comamonas sp. NoAH]
MNKVMNIGATSYPSPQLLIDGQWLGAEGRVTEEVLNPATGEVLALLPHATQQDLEAAVQGAKAAFAGWRAMAPQERARILRAAADLLRERVEAIAQTMTMEQGKPLREARLELLAAADTFDWYAEEGRRNYGRVVPGRTLTQRITVLHEPVGVCAAFTPWNFPVITPARKIAGALAAGCTLVLKLAEETPGCGLALVRALQDSGLPAGVLQAVFGVPSQVSAYLLDHPLIAKFSFTGSSAVGKLLAQQAAKTLKRATMELGGHAPVIVCADAHVQQAADMLVAGKYRNAGQICIAPTRFYVHRSQYDAFVAAFVERVRQIVPGNGLDAACGMGPMANPRRIEAMRSLIADAVQRGAKVECGGQEMKGPGFFWQPTVLTGVPEDARLMNEEPFGPLALINPVDSVEEAIARANRLPYGLASYAFTQDSATRMQLARGLETGMLGINSLTVSMPEAPFGGVKESGWGSECGIEGLQAYCDIKLISED